MKMSFLCSKPTTAQLSSSRCCPYRLVVLLLKQCIASCFAVVPDKYSNENKVLRFERIQECVCKTNDSSPRQLKSIRIGSEDHSESPVVVESTCTRSRGRFDFKTKKSLRGRNKRSGFS